MADSSRDLTARRTLPKAPTGIDGLDEITEGGFPRGRPTLICGSAGCGKTLLSMEFLVLGATRYDEPGVFFAFEESSEELKQNVASLGFDLEALEAEGKLVVDHVHVDPQEIEETGEYDLEGLFIRLGYLIDSIGAKRVVLDTLETLFGGLQNEAILRAELRRLFRWLKDKGVTAVITAERGDGTLTRQGLEEYVSDCVILLDHRVIEQTSTRRLRIVKYRGTSHGTNEYPFLIDEDGFSVLPVTSLGLVHQVSDERVSTGVERLDTMLDGGIYRGSSVLISGTAGSGKSSLSAHFAHATCARNERCLYLAFEEAPAQIKRNMRSIGLDMQPWEDKGLLRFVATRPSFHGLELHLTEIHKQVKAFKPSTVIVDPISNFVAAGSEKEAASMLLRLVDFLKMQGITAVFVNLTSGNGTVSAAAAAAEATDMGISSLIDTWILLRDIELGGERNRGMYVLKSRGTKHSNQIREFVISEHGIDLRDVYVGPEGVLTGSARIQQEAREMAQRRTRELESESRGRTLERKRKALQAQILALQAAFEADAEEAARLDDEFQESERIFEAQRDDMAARRGTDKETI
ncbi:circadian clock protein KaiC [Asticcacaulis solisilvae]|uniref:circadian clock protein KaiC n=1 Tax=Asticcacaulis solisilvae TaxID=1217274 RepID=UPI003FD8339F